MSDLTTQYSDLHNATVALLLARVKDGSATAADLSVARQMLRDNGITAGVHPKSPLRDLAENLPFEDPEAAVG